MPNRRDGIPVVIDADGVSQRLSRVSFDDREMRAAGDGPPQKTPVIPVRINRLIEDDVTSKRAEDAFLYMMA